MAKLIIFQDTKCPECGFTDTQMIRPGNIPEVKALVEAVGNIISEMESNAAPIELAYALRVVENQVTLDPTLLLPLVLAYKPFEDAPDAT